MKKYKYEVTIEIPECDSLEHGENYLQELIQDDLDVEDEGRWKVEVKGSISYENLREFANQYSHNIWEQLMQRFKANDKFYIGANDVSDYVLNAILDTYQKMMEENNESKS